MSASLGFDSDSLHREVITRYINSIMLLVQNTNFWPEICHHLMQTVFRKYKKVLSIRTDCSLTGSINNMKEQLVIIGIDSMDRELLYRYLDVLPNFSQLIEDNADIELSSVFPPDSDTAWASIYTGLNPAKHGIVNFVDPLEKQALYETDYLDNSSIKGKTFWDALSRADKSVCLVYPHVAYPVWKVNGFMIAPKPKSDEFQMYPADFPFDFEFDKLEVPKRIPNTKAEYKTFLKSFEAIVINEFDFARKMHEGYSWDLFFFYSSALDFIQHIFWNYCDPQDPTYPKGKNPYGNVIKDFYVLHDRLIGDFMRAIDRNTILLVLSDHGHSMRPVNLFNINEFLRRDGLLAAKETKAIPLRTISEKAKRTAVDVVQRVGLRGIALTLLRKSPRLKRMYTIPSTIDYEKTIACSSDLSGMKSYTYGGINVYRERLPDEEAYMATRRHIIDRLSKLTMPDSQQEMFEWISCREELYEGPHINKYPDILFKLQEGYGAGWGINLPLFSKTPAHSLFPGSHRRETPVLFFWNLGDRKPLRRTATLMDIAPTILDIFGFDVGGVDGMSLFCDRAWVPSDREYLNHDTQECKVGWNRRAL